MKIFRYTLLLAMCFWGQQILAANYYYKTYDWEENPSLEKLNASDSDQLAIIEKDVRTIEYYYDNDYGTLMQYYTKHTRIRVNSSDAVEIYNKEYIPIARVVKISDLRARVITADGVKNVDKIELKDYEGNDKYSSFKYFAIEGVETGCEVEIIYTLKMSAKLDGGREFFQSDELRRNVSFNIIAPKDMYFSTKSYNGLPEIQLDTTAEGENHFFVEVDKIAALKPELYAPYNNELMRVEYKLDHINPASQMKLYTYDQLSSQLHKYLRQDLSKREDKKLQGVLKEIITDNMDEPEKVRRMEDYVKKNFSVVDQSDDQFEEIGKILENKYCNKRGVVKLFVSLFDLAGINYQYGLTSDRSVAKMDPDFESYSFLENYVFYFPDFNQYMAPTEFLYRLGYIPYNWSDNYGLFVKSVKMGNVSTGVGELRFIEPLPYDLSKDILKVDVDFEGEFDAVNLDIQRSLTGYNATFVQPIYELIPEKESKLVVNELLNLSGKDVVVDDVSVKNTSMDSIYIKPFIVEGKAKTNTSFYDKAGNRFLFKIGEIIGQQVEMYQEDQRKLPVENDFNREYIREIKFNIPEGYSVSNLDDLNIEISHEENGEKSMAFMSNYEREGNAVTVRIKEYYKKINYPVKSFDEFRKVINAAADFNKKVLIFEKSS